MHSQTLLLALTAALAAAKVDIYQQQAHRAPVHVIGMPQMNLRQVERPETQKVYPVTATKVTPNTARLEQKTRVTPVATTTTQNKKVVNRGALAKYTTDSTRALSKTKAGLFLGGAALTGAALAAPLAFKYGQNRPDVTFTAAVTGDVKRIFHNFWIQIKNAPENIVYYIRAAYHATLRTLSKAGEYIKSIAFTTYGLGKQAVQAIWSGFQYLGQKIANLWSLIVGEAKELDGKAEKAAAEFKNEVANQVNVAAQKTADLAQNTADDVKQEAEEVKVNAEEQMAAGEVRQQQGKAEVEAAKKEQE